VPFLLAEVRVASLTVGIERGSGVARRAAGSAAQADDRAAGLPHYRDQLLGMLTAVRQSSPDQEHSGAVGDGHKLVTARACCSSA